MIKRLLKKVLLSAALLVLSCGAFADYQLNMTPGVTPISHDVYALHMAAFWICVGIGVVVFGVMFYSIIMHRRSRHPVPSKFHQHLWLEIAWSIIPLIILIIIAIPATIVLLRMEDTRHSDLVIKVTGYQWKWKYEYLNQGISFYSNLSTPMDQRMNQEPKGPNYLLEVDNPLVVPVGEKIRFLITANDVIHAWWVPSLGIKQDAIPGFIHESWADIKTPGIYRGQCAELCGAGHGFMPIVVEAVSKDDFAKWVAKMTQGKVNVANTSSEKAWTKSELLQKGRQVYKQNCQVCHQADGKGRPQLYPDLGQAPSVVNPDATDQIKTVLYGKAGTAMQGFADTFSNDDVAAVVTYVRSSFAPNSQGIVQPKEVEKIRAANH